VTETLTIAGLSDLARRRCGSLSGGQARRVQYALAVCGRPDLLVLDEPTAAMDQMSRQSLWTTVREAAASGAGVLLTSHDLAEADALADRVLVMDGGRVVADDSPAALRARVGGSVIRCRTNMTLVRLRVMPAVRDAIREGAETRIATTDAVATIRVLADADPALADLRVADASLEDAIAVLLAPQERIAA
jgi:ABC-2 type transport system ATP-binding protein